MAAGHHGLGKLLQVLEEDGSRIKFMLSSDSEAAPIDPSVANALRRVLIAEVCVAAAGDAALLACPRFLGVAPFTQVPTVAVESVQVFNNATPMHDEYLVHRMGLLPIRFKGTGQGPMETLVDHEHFPLSLLSEDASIEQIKLRLCVSNGVRGFDVAGEELQPIRNVTTADLEWWVDGMWVKEHPHFEVAHFADRAEAHACEKDGGILITKLGKSQSLSLCCDCRVGIGRIHYKWSPVCTVAMTYVPEIRINPEVAEACTAEELQQFVMDCQVGLFEFREDTKQVVVADASILANRIDVEGIGMELARSKKMSENLVTITYKPNTYIFEVESTGALTPAQIVLSALQVLERKLAKVADAASEIDRTTTAAGAEHDAPLL